MAPADGAQAGLDGPRRSGDVARGEQGTGETERELLAVAVEAAQAAGSLLAERARAGAERSVSSKSSPTDLVSEADVTAERSIRELLARRRPDDGFLGEEEGAAGGTSGLVWVVDPLDGTVNFLFGIPQWSVSVAVRDDAGRTLAGAVYDPNRDELFTATRSGEARLRGRDGAEVALAGRASDPGGNSGGDGAAVEGATSEGARTEGARAERVESEGARTDRAGPGGAESAQLASAMIATGFAYDAEVRRAQAAVLARVIPRVRDIRRFGSAALDLAWTAAGRCDAYFERSVKPWDIASGTLICERAGLRLLELPELDGLPWGILVARDGLAEALFELVAGR